ncbi:MAG: lipid kinase [Chloroflexota bacterium]|nr:lipid kinase [Chloroflexota bacterium]
MSQVTDVDNQVDLGKVPVVLIVNTKARKGQEFFGLARIALHAAGVNVVENYPLSHAKRLPGLVQSLVERGIKSIVLGGGDGSISSVVDYLVDNDVTLGVLPLGTANDFARTLHMPNIVEDACKVIAQGRTTKIDLGIVNNRHYINVASVGFGAAVVEYTSGDSKKLLGSLAYPLAAARAAFHHRPFTARLTFSNQTIETQAIHIAVANGCFYGGGVLVTPNARIDDNELVVTIFEPMNAVELGEVSLHLRDGLYVHHPKVRVFRKVRKLHLDIVHGGQKRINVDGELWSHTPAEFGIANNALKVFVPEEFGLQVNDPTSTHTPYKY